MCLSRQQSATRPHSMHRAPCGDLRCPRAAYTPSSRGPRRARHEPAPSSSCLTAYSPIAKPPCLPRLALVELPMMPPPRAPASRGLLPCCHGEALLFSSWLTSQPSQLEFANEPSRAQLLSRLHNEPSRAGSISTLTYKRGTRTSIKSEITLLYFQKTY